jgi:hypothetical protein
VVLCYVDGDWYQEFSSLFDVVQCWGGYTEEMAEVPNVLAFMVVLTRWRW